MPTTLDAWMLVLDGVAKEPISDEEGIIIKGQWRELLAMAAELERVTVVHVEPSPA